MVQQEVEVRCIEVGRGRVNTRLRKLLSGLFEFELEATVVHCDNQSGIKLSENPVFHDRSKHIDIR